MQWKSKLWVFIEACGCQHRVFKKGVVITPMYMVQSLLNFLFLIRVPPYTHPCVNTELKSYCHLLATGFYRKFWSLSPANTLQNMEDKSHCLYYCDKMQLTEAELFFLQSHQSLKAGDKDCQHQHNHLTTTNWMDYQTTNNQIKSLFKKWIRAKQSILTEM